MDQELFSNMEKASQQQSVATADGRMHVVKGRGNVHFLLTNDEINLKNVLYMLGLRQNLISAGQYVRSNDQVLIFGKKCCTADANLNPRKFTILGYWDENLQLYKLTYDSRARHNDKKHVLR